MHAVIADPNLSLLLIVIGILAVYVEFSAPGLVLPGAIGAAMAMIGVSSLIGFPLTFKGSAMLLLSLLCYILEARFVSHGLLTLAGAALMILGALYLIDARLSPLVIRPVVAFTLAIPFAGISSFLFSVAYKARQSKLDM